MEAYVKKPLNHEMAQRSRRRRVKKKNDTFEEWAKGEGVTTTQLLGYFLHLDNYHDGDRDVASMGWRIFTGGAVLERPKFSLEEASWMIEKAGISQVVFNIF